MLRLAVYYSIQQPQPIVLSESIAPSYLHITTPQDTVINSASSSYFPPADFVHSQIPVSTQAELSYYTPVPFQYTQPEDIFSLTNNPCQWCGRYDPSRHFIPPSSSSMEHGVEPYQQFEWLDSNLNTQYCVPLPIPSLPYVPNASSTFPGNSDNDIYADDITGIVGSSHLASESPNDATSFLPFQNYDANSNLHSYYTGMWFKFGDRLFLAHSYMSLCVLFRIRRASLPLRLHYYVHPIIFIIHLVCV